MSDPAPVRPTRLSNWMLGPASGSRWRYAAGGGLALVFLADMVTPLGFAHGILYPPLVLAAMMARSRRLVAVVSIAAIVLTVAGAMLSPAPADVTGAVVAANRLFSLVAIGITAVLALAMLDLTGRLQGANRSLVRAQDVLDEAQQRMRLILNSVGEGIHGLDTAGNIVFENPAAIAMFGWEESELLGRHAHALVHHHRADGSEYPVAECPIYRTLRDGVTRRVGDEVFFRKDGSSFPVEYVCAPVIGEGGAISGAVVSFSDVTERVRAQIVLRERIKELRCLYHVLELTTDEKRPLATVFDDVAALLPESMLHSEVAVARVTVRGVEHRSPDWRAPHAALRAPIVDGGREIGEVEVGYTDRRPEQPGGEGPFLREERSLLDGVALHLARMVYNRRMADTLAHTERLNAIGSLTGGIAHDFNNLLTVILGNAELLLEELGDDPLRRPLAELVAGAAQRGAELTQRLLAFARKQPLNPEIVDVNRLVEGMAPLLRRTLGEDVALRFTPGAALWRSVVDPGQLEGALLNLCLNARDAMPQGGSLVLETANSVLDPEYAGARVDVQPGEYVCIAVSDSGTGIPREQLDRVFEPFFTTKEKGKGTGLGLPMVYGFVKQTGGHIEIYSEPGDGTVVRMYLPRAVEAGQAAAAGPAPAEAGSVGGNETILLVEDDAPVRRYAREQLAALGYSVLEAVDGPSALELLRGDQEIDLLFTDVVMPGGMSGRQLADEAVRLRPGLRVLYTSGYSEDAIVHHGRLDPGVKLLSKPYRRADLALKVRAALSGKG